MKIIFRSFFLILLLALSLLISKSVVYSQTLDVDPAMIDVEVGEEFEVDLVFMNDGTVQTIATQLSFDPETFGFVSAMAGVATQGTLTVIVTPGTPGGTPGNVLLAVTSNQNIPDGVVLTVTFMTITDDQSELSITNTTFADENEEEVEGEVVNGGVNAVEEENEEDDMPEEDDDMSDEQEDNMEDSDSGNSSGGCGSIANAGTIGTSSSVVNLLIFLIPGLIVGVRKIKRRRLD